MKKWVRISSIFLIICVFLGVVSLFISSSKNTTDNLSYEDYSIGGLDSKGKYIERDDSIFTPERFNAYELKVTPKFTFNGQFEVFFYNAEDEFILSSGLKSGTYEPSDTFYTFNVFGSEGNDGNIALYCRIMIVPSSDYNEELNFFDKFKIARNINISYSNKEITLSKNLFDFEKMDKSALCEECYVESFDGKELKILLKEYDYFVVINPYYDTMGDHILKFNSRVFNSAPGIFSYFCIELSEDANMNEFIIPESMSDNVYLYGVKIG